MEINISNFCLVCYYDKETNKLAHVEHYYDDSLDIESDIRSYEYGYNAIIAKPEQIIEQLQKLRSTLDEIREIANVIVNGTHFTTDIEGHLKELTKRILQLIKRAKG